MTSLYYAIQAGALNLFRAIFEETSLVGDSLWSHVRFSLNWPSLACQHIPSLNNGGSGGYQLLSSPLHTTLRKSDGQTLSLFLSIFSCLSLSSPIFKKIMCMCTFPTWMSAHRLHAVFIELDPLKLQLQTAVRCQVDPGNLLTYCFTNLLWKKGDQKLKFIFNYIMNLGPVGSMWGHPTTGRNKLPQTGGKLQVALGIGNPLRGTCSQDQAAKKDNQGLRLLSTTVSSLDTGLWVSYSD